MVIDDPSMVMDANTQVRWEREVANVFNSKKNETKKGLINDEFEIRSGVGYILWLSGRFWTTWKQPPARPPILFGNRSPQSNIYPILSSVILGTS